MMTILGISGSMRWPSHTHTMVDIALCAAREQGARVEHLDIRTLALPLYEPKQLDIPPIVSETRERLQDAHAFIIGTPEYHGNMSGALKNLLDYLYEETTGKLFGFVVSTGNDQGASVLSQFREVISYMHAWALPYGVTASLADFDDAGHLATPQVRESLLQLGRDIVVYGDMLYQQSSLDKFLPRRRFSG